MRLNSNRDHAPDPGVYWRRRFLILSGTLVVLAVLAWLFASGGSAPAAGRPAAALRSGDTLPSAAYGSAWPGNTPSPTASASGGAPSAPSSATRTASGQPGPSASTSAADPAGCTPGSIVLSLSTSRASYGRSASPQFEVYAVSTASSPCTMAYGPGAVHVVVTRNGEVVWDSASCGAAAATKVQFQLGVPQVVTIRWNRHATTPSGCAGSLPPNASGKFDAVALMAGQASAIHTFTLLG